MHLIHSIQTMKKTPYHAAYTLNELNACAEVNLKNLQRKN